MVYKIQEWDQYLEEESLSVGFAKQEIAGDIDGLTLYRTRVDFKHLGQNYMYVILDDTIYSTIRFELLKHEVVKEVEDKVLAFVNRENPSLQGVKLFVADETLFIDSYYLSTNKAFDPSLLMTISKEIMSYITSVAEEIRGLVPVVEESEEAAEEEVNAEKAVEKEEEKNSDTDVVKETAEGK